LQIEDSNIALNHKAFQELFNEHYSSLCRFAVSFLKDNDSAEEVVQQVFVNLWDKRDLMDAEKSIKTYLFTSVKNRSLNFIRDNKKYRSYYLDIEGEMEIPVSEKDIISEADLNTQVKNALDKLPEKCREIFELCRFEEMKYKEVAEKLGISQKTVEAQMSKALKIMREELKDLFVVLMIWYWGSMN
jgi:RNA polymerase sigma-70 factor, ECF subfamily